ncbi:MAG TPA: diguanylate cyclase [Methylomirabilota bacterium]|nr:diguanylate cyclase [Methylomirabilota bacterium]
MDHDTTPPLAHTGREVKRKALLALMLTSFVPLLILAYSLGGYIMAMLDPGRTPGHLLGSQVLLVLAGLLTACGGFVIWDIASSVGRAAGRVGGAKGRREALVETSTAAGALMSSFTRMLTTVEQQAEEINLFARRLDSAYKELESTNARLKEFSFRDEVTRLYNRRFFSIRLEEEVSRYRRFNRPVSVALLDLDAFKLINDELGHPVGDETLREVGELLLRYSRGINVICRYGGDEFAVLLVETSKTGARQYGERMRRIIEAHPFSHGRPVTASLGVASIPEDVGPDAEELVRAADEALYRAKRSGKNHVWASGGKAFDDDLFNAPLEGPAETRGFSRDVWDELVELERPPRIALVGPEDFADRPGSDVARELLATLEGTCQATLEALTTAIATRDPATHAHSRRVLTYTVALARAHGVPEWSIRDIEHGVLLHDIGKIGIPDTILLKPGPLTPDEWKIMRMHPEMGRRLVERIPFLRGALPIIYHHHERWDGSGYPLGLTGEQIPLGPRLFAVADAFDAMTFDRPYHRAVSFDAARAEVERSARNYFDPAVVATFLAMPLEPLFEVVQRQGVV